MAEVFPHERTSVPAEWEDLIAFCAKLPPRWNVHVGWPEIGHQAPDVLVTTPEGRAALMCASAANSATIDGWSWDSPTDRQGMPARRLARAIRALAESPFTSVLRMLVLTRTRASSVSLFVSSLPAGIDCRSLAEMTVSACEALIAATSPVPGLVSELLACISRPTLVQPAMTVVPMRQATYRFLDRAQELWLRRYLTPPEWDERNAKSSGAQLVTGVAGCGKSLLLLYRACFERKANPQQRILFVTHNQALTHDLNFRLGLLGQQLNIKPIAIQRFYQWCASWAKPWPQALSDRERLRVIQKIMPATARDADIDFHAQEFSWIKDHGVATLDDYRRAERPRMPRSLDREQLWTRFEQYEAELAQISVDKGRTVTDWPGVILHSAKLAELHGPEPYEIVFVDEAQFFSPVAFRILKRVLAKDGRIVFAADPTQGFLPRKTPWSSLGFDMRGRSTRLRRAYRCTRRILEFARDFYLKRVQEEPDSDINLPADEDLIVTENEAPPELVRVPRQQDEQTVAARMITDLIQKKTPANQILVVHDWRTVLHPPPGATWFTQDAKEKYSADAVRTCTFDAATGLEASHVLVLGLRSIFEQEDDPMYAESRPQRVLDNTRKAYMAFTRAGQRLLVIWSGASEPTWWPHDASTKASR